MSVNKRKILSIDLGGSSAKLAIINSDKEIEIRLDKIKTNLEDPIKNIWNILSTKYPNLQFDAIGFATAGMINEKKGIVLIAGNLNWKNYDLKEELKKYTNKPCFLINDANAAALGEYWVGAGKFSDSLIFYTIGTGIGGGIIINNQLITGSIGTAGEFGHGGNFQSQIKCNCGIVNCLEPISSAKSIQNDLLKLKKPIKLRNITNQILINNKDIREVFIKHWEVLASHISIMIYALNPEIVIIGGGVSNIGEEVANLLYMLVNKKVSKSILGNLKIKVANLGNDAGIYGAAKNALNKLNK